MKPSKQMREIARCLMGEVKGHLEDLVYQTWQPVTRHQDGHAIREVGMEAKRQGEEVQLCCKYANHADMVWSSRCVKCGTLEEVRAWLTDDTHIIEVAQYLEDLYDHTHTWN